MRIKVILALLLVFLIVTFYNAYCYGEEGVVMQNIGTKSMIPDAMDVATFGRNVRKMEERIDLRNDIESNCYTVYDVFDDIEIPSIEETKGLVGLSSPFEYYSESICSMPAAPPRKDVMALLTIQIEPATAFKSKALKLEGAITLDPYLESNSKYGAFSVMTAQQELLREKVIIPTTSVVISATKKTP